MKAKKSEHREFMKNALSALNRGDIEKAKLLMKEAEAAITDYYDNVDRLTNERGERLYYFHWIGGGYNSEWALDEDDLIKRVSEKYSSSYKVDTSTIVWVTRAESDEWDRMGFMMTC